MGEPTYSIGRTYDQKSPNGRWEIVFLPKGYGPDPKQKIVYESDIRADDIDDSGEPPERVRLEYEKLLQYNPSTYRNAEAINVVELMTSDGDCAFDQPCKWGRRVEGHAVYCHNPTWLYAPSKCRRRSEASWVGDAWPHELCAGFSARKPAAGSNDNG